MPSSIDILDEIQDGASLLSKVRVEGVSSKKKNYKNKINLTGGDDDGTKKKKKKKVFSYFFFWSKPNLYRREKRVGS